MFSRICSSFVLSCALTPLSGAGSFVRPSWNEMKPIAREDLVRSVEASARRLEDARYSPERVFQVDVGAQSWPGDTEGRTTLALVLQEAALGRKSKHLDGILRQLPAHLNGKGYMGNVHTNFVDEQQLSGNGWMLRALCAYARLEKSPVIDAKSIARRLARGLFLPCRGAFVHYPIDPAGRKGGGGASGNVVEEIADGWRLSTDVGCFVIGVDGLVDAYALTGDEDLKPVIEEALARYLAIDLVAIKAQTHATLTGLRALLRYDARRFLPEVEKRFDLYVRYGMTDRYENYNWFGRTDTWTEPCAIVDSVLVARELHRIAGKPDYATYAARFLDALLAHQRDNGGFGLQKTFPKGSGHEPVMEAYEAYWCCTMRGGAGLAAVLLETERQR